MAGWRMAIIHTPAVSYNENILWTDDTPTMELNFFEFQFGLCVLGFRILTMDPLSCAYHTCLLPYHYFNWSLILMTIIKHWMKWNLFILCFVYETIIESGWLAVWLALINIGNGSYFMFHFYSYIIVFSIYLMVGASWMHLVSPRCRSIKR